jgi:hypothetical protein
MTAREHSNRFENCPLAKSPLILMVYGLPDNDYFRLAFFVARLLAPA